MVSLRLLRRLLHLFQKYEPNLSVQRFRFAIYVEYITRKRKCIPTLSGKSPRLYYGYNYMYNVQKYDGKEN